MRNKNEKSQMIGIVKMSVDLSIPPGIARNYYCTIILVANCTQTRCSLPAHTQILL